MKVVIDIGNARIKWARAQAGALRDAGSALHAHSVAGALAALEQALPARAERVLVANVASREIGAAVAALVRRHLGIEPELAATAREQCGVRCAYAEPSRLGVDRWLAMLAAFHGVGGAACIVSAGTAVTFDAVDSHGQHLGGLIFAGPRLAANALQHNTRNIGATSGSAARTEGLELLGRNTEDAVSRGAMLALGAAVDRAAGVVQRALRSRPPLLITGGDAELLRPWLEVEAQLRPNMVLEGLALIAERS